MKSNLANIYAVFSHKYVEGGLSVNYAQPVSYLMQIVGAEENSGKVVFLFEEDRNRLQSLNFASPPLKKSPKSNDDLDLTGSPLKDNCAVEVIGEISFDLKLAITNPWRPEEESHKGMAVEKARSIICAEEFQRKAADDEAQGSVWLLCSGADVEKTLALQYEFVGGDHFSRGLITFMGMAPAQSVNAQSLLRRHYALIRPDTGVETYIENTYHIKSHHMAIRCCWSTTAPQPHLVDLSSCDVTLSQTFMLSECGPLTEDFMIQLRILKIIRDDILAFKETEVADLGKEAIYRCGRGIDMEDLRESINKVMTEISGFAEIDTGSGTEGDIEAVVQRAKQRRLTDLTDKLWEILKCCSSYKDLKMAFNILFQCAARCNIVNTPTNKNRLAEIITEVANRRLAIPCLTGSEPLELLLEIGLEKLYKDYEFIFTESKICSASNLRNKSTLVADKENTNERLNVRKSLRNAVRPESTPARKTLLHNNVKGANKFKSADIVGFKNSNFDERDTAVRLKKLLQIHCTLEHLLMIHVHLNLSYVYGDVCDQLLKKPTRSVDLIGNCVTDEMEISLSPHEVREHLEGKDPHSRRITLKSKNKFREVKSTFFYSMENVCPPGISECFHTDDKEIAKDNIYYCWLYRKIKSLK